MNEKYVTPRAEYQDERLRKFPSNYVHIKMSIRATCLSLFTFTNAFVRNKN